MNNIDNNREYELFGEWFDSQLGIKAEPKQEDQAQTPNVKDGGTNINYANQDHRTEIQKFTDFIKNFL